MDIDNGTQETQSDVTNNGGTDIEQSLLQQFSRLGTTDKDELVQQLQQVVDLNLKYSTATFFLDMNNWNLQEAVCSYLDMQNPLHFPSMALVANPIPNENENIEPNREFEKTWHICNNGTDPWPCGCYAQCSLGDDFGGARVQIPEVLPGEGTLLTVRMRSPSKPGIYQSKWRLCTPRGSYFGDPLWAILTVVEDGTVQITEQLQHFNELGASVSVGHNPFIPYGSQNSSSDSSSQNVSRPDENSDMC